MSEQGDGSKHSSQGKLCEDLGGKSEMRSNRRTICKWKAPKTSNKTSMHVNVEEIRSCSYIGS